MIDRSPVPPVRDLQRAADAQARFEATIGGLQDVDVRRPSALAGWTVAHVLAHVARNADSHRRRADAACRGEIVDQYPGGFSGRSAEIEVGSARRATELIGDVRESAEAMVTAWRRVPAASWANVTRDVSGRERPLHELPGRRWQELEVHVVDLDVGVTHRDWPEDFVAWWLPQLRTSVADRLPTGVEPVKRGVLDERDELAWLYGRLQRPDLPDLAPWG